METSSIFAQHLPDKSGNCVRKIVMSRPTCKGFSAVMQTGHGQKKPLAHLADPDAAGTIPEMAHASAQNLLVPQWLKDLADAAGKIWRLVQVNLTNSCPFSQAAGTLHEDWAELCCAVLVHLLHGSFATAGIR